MAIFSLHHSWVGRSTHPPGTAGAHVRYITRSDAATVILGERLPLDRRVYAWLEDQEQSDRRNARVIDRVTVALPVELTRDQNVELLQSFGERMTEGRASWMAAIHAGPGDADNPHAHIAFRDRDVDTFRRVMLTTEAGSTQRFREAWEQEVNKALERAGLEVRVDCRSLKDQGIDREPQIHVGPAAQRLSEREHDFESNAKLVTRLIHGKPTEVTVNYPAIDEGKTRVEENEARKMRNWVRALEQTALEGPVRPEDMPAMERIALQNLRLDTRYREAMRTGALPAEDNDPISAVIREQMSERQQGRDEPRRHAAPIDIELRLPMDGYAKAAPASDESDELKRRKDEYEKLKETPGMEHVLRARDYLNALTWERGDAPPSDHELLAYLSWSDANRLPVPKDSRAQASVGPKSGGDEPAGRAPKRDASDLIAGGGLAAIGKIADSLETLFDGRPAEQIERDERIMAEKRTIEQITEEQQRKQEAEAEKHRRAELDAYLQQRDRERHIDRGR